jgi:hypothetical protein
MKDIITFFNFWLRILAVPLIVGAAIGFVCYAVAHALGLPGHALPWAVGGCVVAFVVILIGVILLINSESM